ncbi:chitobiase/beta-hexosaminidase C-terminal domain-containing protein [Dysgonomonas sp. 520]|uniref:chitobiase/beta-hexosaminidase C-terminal domain-containing protein n=1 Tax=Dysgonomonas sp. 520 TaxID=2302931 RepID=UPI0013D370C8|nr:chitobiase/beta-hexosaminidase C-terminal domain-containing protein [Dysgonomonas sp. 520]
MMGCVTLSGYAEGTKKILINEFLALNSNGMKDEDGDNSDWIELYNPGSEAINLKGWTITDNASKLDKWTFPSVTINAGGYLVIFASEKDKSNSGSNLHTNFKLSGGGEYLAILEPGQIVSDEYAPYYPAQQTDISYGHYMGQHTIFATPTPGAENTFTGQALAPVFSKTRGYFDEAFSVTLSVGDPDTKIYYTTDGTRPTESSTLYTAPINITTTTPLSAIGVKDGVSSAVTTNTYFFVKDIVKQPANPAGYPAKWGHLAYGTGGYAAGEKAPADYEMDPEICNNAAYKDLLEDAFLAIPTLSIVTTPGYIFSDSRDPETGGIYIYTGKSGNPKNLGGGTLGDGWERPTSIEYFEPKTGKQFQINCGLRLHGGNSRRPYNSGKHSFRVHFKKIYGAGNLHYDLFDDDTANDKFGHLVFRAGYNFSWITGGSGDNADQRLRAQYMVDPFAKKTQSEMGHHAVHDRFAHLFINGLYWGLYDISERVRNQFTSEYMGGKEEDYDVIDDDGLVEGQLTAYNQMLSLAKSKNYNELISQKLLNMENFIDYMLLNFYIGNDDWGKNNWYTARNRVNPGKGFQYFSWDAENALSNVNNNKILNFEGPLREMLFGASKDATNGGLSQNAEFKLLFMDRVQKHFLNDGVLTPEKTAERYLKLADEIDLPIILESARWGDYRKKVLTRDNVRITYTRNDHWIPMKDALCNDYFPARTEIVYNQLKALGLTTPIDAPVFSSKGGSITEPIDLTISATSGSIYYTIDGTDPRVANSGDVSSGGLLYNSPLQVVGKGTIKARAKNGSTWSALSEVTFKDGGQSGMLAEQENAVNIYYDNGMLHYVLPSDGNVTIEIYSAEGKCVQRISNNDAFAGVNHIELTNYSRGVYIYKMVYNNSIVSGKFVK